jgi:hypothetical protein
LFAGFLSAFLIELLGRLERDPLDIIQDVLIYQTQMMRNSSLGPYVPADFSPPEHIVVVNALFYASLGVMILAAFIAMLIKSWVREFDRGLRAMSLPEQRAKTREFRYLGMERWKLPEMVGILPFLIQISLLLFAIGLVIFLFHISKPSCGVTTIIFGVGIFYYAMTTSISVVVTSSPFRSPLSRSLGKAYQRVHAYFCPPIEYFLSDAMDTTPATTLGHVSRHIHIFLQKSRPYLENDFVEPISATTVDEVQLSTVVSALQRIHDSAPDSQHSEALQWSVWQVAGSATLRIPPLFDLPSWILNKRDDEEYFASIPPFILVALVAVSLRTQRTLGFSHIDIILDVLKRKESIKGSWVQLVTTVCDCYVNFPYAYEPSDLTRVVQRKGLHEAESLWLLRTLSELCSEGCLQREAPFLIEICLEILLDHPPRWSYRNLSSLILLEAVVTLAAISCSPDRDNRRNIIASSREHPWLLLNIRNPALFGNWFKDTRSNCHKSIISILFLVVYILINRGSYSLAAQYFAIITAKGDLPFHTSALTTVAPAIEDAGLPGIARLFVGQRQESTLVIVGSTFYEEDTVLEKLLKSYDRHLGASENPNPSSFAILLVLSKHFDLSAIGRLERLNLELKNPWLRLVARAIARLDIPDGSVLPMELCSDHRIHNMIAALSLLRYTEGRGTLYTESLLLASFLQSREFAISSVALEYYMKTVISYHDPLSPSSHLSQGVHSVFNLMLPDHQLRMGWRVLETFVNGFDNLPVEWRRTFAESFFTLSRQSSPRPQGDTETNAPELELNGIITWKYFHKEEPESELSDSEFSGLDWMAMAWSLHLSQKSRSVPRYNEEFVLRALRKLLDAASYHRIIPIIPKLREFIEWFGDTDLYLSEYRRMIFTR